MTEFRWGTSPEGEDEAARAARQRQKEFQRELDKVIERELGIPPRSEYKGVTLDKDETVRQMFTSSPSQQAMKRAATEKQKERETPAREVQARTPAYDSVARRQALAKHLEKMGVSPELIQARLLVELGQAKPPAAALDATDRRDPNSKGAAMRAREKEARERGISRGE